MPYRHHDQPARESVIVNGWCPSCRAAVAFDTTDAAAICAHCDARFATTFGDRAPVMRLSAYRWEPHHGETPAPLRPPVADDGPSVTGRLVAAVRFVLLVLGSFSAWLVAFAWVKDAHFAVTLIMALVFFPVFGLILTRGASWVGLEIDEPGARDRAPRARASERRGRRDTRR